MVVSIQALQVLETDYFEAFHELLESEKQGTVVSVTYGLTVVVRRVFCEVDRPKKRIFGEYPSQQIQLNPILT